MSYCKTPYCIYTDGEYLHFDLNCIPEEKINLFLYQIFLADKREELKVRLNQGRHLWINDKRTISDEIEKRVKDLQYLEDSVIKGIMSID